jgi:hypothetical protein
MYMTGAGGGGCEGWEGQACSGVQRLSRRQLRSSRGWRPGRSGVESEISLLETPGMLSEMQLYLQHAPPASPLPCPQGPPPHLEEGVPHAVVVQRERVVRRGLALQLPLRRLAPRRAHRRCRAAAAAAAAAARAHCRCARQRVAAAAAAAAAAATAAAGGLALHGRPAAIAAAARLLLLPFLVRAAAEWHAEGVAAARLNLRDPLFGIDDELLGGLRGWGGFYFGRGLRNREGGRLSR